MPVFLDVASATLTLVPASNALILSVKKDSTFPVLNNRILCLELRMMNARKTGSNTSVFVIHIPQKRREKNIDKSVSMQVYFPLFDFITILQKNRLDEMHKNFDQYVDSDIVANYLNISPKIVKRIYEYWIWKR